jgi:hypothetical protein
VSNDLSSLRARESESEPMHDVVEARLEEAEHLFAGAPFAPGRVEVVPLKLALQNAINTPHLLLFAKANGVLAEFHTRLAVLAGRVGASRV